MAVFSDGNLAENQLDKGNPLELGYDKWTNNLYDNKAFLHNTVHYLMNENERLLLRSKKNTHGFFKSCPSSRTKTANTNQGIYASAFGYDFCGLRLTSLQTEKISSITFDKFLFNR